MQAFPTMRRLAKSTKSKTQTPHEVHTRQTCKKTNPQTPRKSTCSALHCHDATVLPSIVVRAHRRHVAHNINVLDLRLPAASGVTTALFERSHCCHVRIISCRCRKSSLSVRSRCSSRKCLRIGSSGGFPHVSSCTTLFSSVQSSPVLRTNISVPVLGQRDVRLDPAKKLRNPGQIRQYLTGCQAY